MNTALTKQELEKISGASTWVYSFICAMPDLRCGIYTADLDYAEGEISNCQMKNSLARANMFGIIAITENIPAGYIFVENIELISELIN